MMQHPAYTGLFDYDALKARSNQNYDAMDAGLREDGGSGSYNNTMNIMANQQNKLSPWAPYFQALQEQGVNKVGQDAARPMGIASAPGWGQGLAPLADTGDQIAAQPLMASTNFAHPAMMGLRKAGRR